jgi:hypothetical protein
VTTTLATVATLTLPPTSSYLVWAKVSLRDLGASARDVSCYLTTGADGSSSGAFDLSTAEVPAGANETIPLQGTIFVFGDASTKIRLQCQTATGTDVLAGPRLQAVKVATLTNSP